jgi:hypothetical protein
LFTFIIVKPSFKKENEPDSLNSGNPSVLGLEQGSLPSETLKRGSLQIGQSMGVAEGNVLRASYLMAHRSNVLLQVFSGETTLFLRIDLRS